jgi:molybdopterin/thiamine biosynthesis adenylyltransferase
VPARLDLQAILDDIATSGLLRSPRRPGGAVGALEGEVDVEGRAVTVQLDLRPPFPLALPRVWLRPWDALGFIPHVDPSGNVCYLDAEGTVLDSRRPVALAKEALALALDVLAEGVAGRNCGDFADEWEVHWSRAGAATTLISVLDPPSRASDVLVIAERRKGGEVIQYLAAQEADIDAFWKVCPAGAVRSCRRALYVPLDEGALPTPPPPGGPFWTPAEARAFVWEHLPAGQRKRLAKEAKRLRRRFRGRSTEFVVLGLPRPSGGLTLFGARFEGAHGQHPLLEGGKAASVLPLRIVRMDRAYLVPRGGADTSLSRKRVLVVGCGAVGGHVAVELARAGVLRITLVDADTLRQENFFRHVLGRSSLTMGKAEALKSDIEGRLPYVEIEAVPARIEEALADGRVHLGNHDLVVVALGNPTVELELNALLLAMPNPPPAVFTWVEPYGIGGHALLTTGRKSDGCFECLYTAPSPDAGEPLRNRAAFAAPGQRFGRALAGCGSLHTPFGSLDAVQTAVVAVRLGLDALTGRRPSGALCSWKGDPQAFESASFTLAGRFNAPTGFIDVPASTYRAEGCLACGPSARAV